MIGYLKKIGTGYTVGNERPYRLIAVTPNGNVLYYDKNLSLYKTENCGLSNIVACGFSRGVYVIVAANGQVLYSHTGEVWNMGSATGRNIISADSIGYDVFASEHIFGARLNTAIPRISRFVSNMANSSWNIHIERNGENNSWSSGGINYTNTDTSGGYKTKNKSDIIFSSSWFADMRRDSLPGIFIDYYCWSNTLFSWVYNNGFSEFNIYNYPWNYRVIGSSYRAASLYDYLVPYYINVGNLIVSYSRRYYAAYGYWDEENRFSYTGYENKVFINNNLRIDGWFCMDYDFIGNTHILALGTKSVGGAYYDGFDTYKLVYSTNLTSFTDALTLPAQPNRLRVKDGVAYCACNNGYLYRSTNGISWTQMTTNTSEHIVDVA